MVTDDGLRRLLRDREAANVERAACRADRDKFGDAICTFAYDLPDLRAPGDLSPAVSSIIVRVLGFGR